MTISREQEESWLIPRGRKRPERWFPILILASNLTLKVMDKLAKISKLKEEVAGGKQLEKNQLEMISKEKELTEELKMLQL